jgi:hypothetical protein
MKKTKKILYTDGKKIKTHSVLDLLISLDAFVLAFLLSIKMLGKRKALGR